jgi:hypothetical protein
MRLTYSYMAANKSRNPKGAKARPPLRTYSECAELIGISQNKLSRLRGIRDAPPFPAIAIKGIGQGPDYYDPELVKAWFKTFSQPAATPQSTENPTNHG